MKTPLFHRNKISYFLIIIFFFLINVFIYPKEKEPIKIGVSLSLSGKYANLGNMQKKGFELWANKVNSENGILGRKVRLIIYNDNSDPVVAVDLYNTLILNDKVDLLFSPYSSQVTEAILPITEENGYPLLISGASSDILWKKNYKYVFGVFTIASKYTIGFLELLVLNNISRIAIISADDVFSKYCLKGTEKWAKRFGLSIKLKEVFDKEKKDLIQIAEKVLLSGAQTIIVCGHYNESVNIKLAFRRINWSPQIYYATIGPAHSKYYEDLQQSAEKTFSSTHWHYYSKFQFPGSKEFSENFINKYKKEPSYLAATAYAAGQIFEAAIKKSGDLDRNKIRNILSIMDTISIIGRYGVDKNGKQIRHFTLIMQWQNGKKEIVWPKEFQTAKPILK